MFEVDEHITEEHLDDYLVHYVMLPENYVDNLSESDKRSIILEMDQNLNKCFAYTILHVREI